VAAISVEELAIALTASLIVLAIPEEIKKAASKAIAMPKSAQPKRQRLKSGDFPLRWKLQRQKFPALFHQSSYLIRNTHSELMRLFG
jgi:hypothetical protein